MSLFDDGLCHPAHNNGDVVVSLCLIDHSFGGNQGFLTLFSVELFDYVFINELGNSGPHAGLHIQHFDMNAFLVHIAQAQSVSQRISDASEPSMGTRIRIRNLPRMAVPSWAAASALAG